LNKQSVILEKVAMKGMTRREEAEAEYKDDGENAEEEDEAVAYVYHASLSYSSFFFLCTEQAGCLPVLTQLLMNPLLQLQSAVPEAAKKMYRDVCVATKINNRCPTGNEADVE
jgi:hypothetical protein